MVEHPVMDFLVLADRNFSLGCFVSFVIGVGMFLQDFLWPQILRGLPLVFCVAPAVTLGLGSFLVERLKYTSGLFTMMRNSGGAVGIAVSGTVLNSRTNFHFLCSRKT
ncbi:MAG: hypothetical protein POH28_01710 [Acidocella sp.]|nr:hypothetical protein [Acidocella sp.]